MQQDIAILLGVPYMDDSTIQMPDGITVTLDKFCELFKDVNSLTYNEFVRVDAGRLGYKKYFDTLKEQGVIL